MRAAIGAAAAAIRYTALLAEVSTSMIRRPSLPPWRARPAVPPQRFFFLMIRRPPTPTLFPYTTLFRFCRSVHAPVLISTRDQRHVPQALVVGQPRSEEHTSELQSHSDLVCRLLLEK